MVRRRALGATMASAVVFTTIIVSSLAVYVASQSYAGLATTADSEAYLSSEYAVLVGSGGTDVLVGAQRFLAATTLPCGSAEGVVASYLAGLGVVQSAPNLTVVITPSLAGGDRGDNLSALGGYAGSVAGEFDVSLLSRGSGAEANVGFNLTETHWAHLPVEISMADSLCKEAAGSIRAALEGGVFPNCTSASVAGAIGGATYSYAAEAPLVGLSLGFTYSAVGAAACQVTYAVTVGEDGIQGPAGPFSVRFEEAGSVTVATAASTPAA